MCRWLERDPAGYQDGPSLYSYLGRNPMAGTDPYGLALYSVSGDSRAGRAIKRRLAEIDASKPSCRSGAKREEEFGSEAEFRRELRINPDRREDLGKVGQGIGTAIETTASLLPGGGFATAVNEASQGNFGAAALNVVPGEKVAGLFVSLLFSKAGLAKLATGASDELYVIGRSWDTKVAKDWNGHVVLDVETWSEGLNRAWVDEAVAARRTFYVASPTQGNLVQASGKFAGDETVFAKELRWLQEAGYIRVGDYLVHPSRVAEFLQP